MLKDKIKEAVGLKKPFVVYRKNNTSEVKSIFQNNTTTYNTKDFTESGFVFAPFDDAVESLLIPYSESIISIVDEDLSPIDSEEGIDTVELQQQSEKHQQLVSQGVDFINATNTKKVVLSRCQEIILDDTDEFEIFKRLLDKYPSAFVYLWYHPKTGFWLGATPERLLNFSNNKFKVMALASTQEYQGTTDVNWGEKEKEEHQFVVEYIQQNLKEFQVSTSETYTVQAGSLLHLRADITGQIAKEKVHLKGLIKAIHPTPATCGLPKNEAKSFILKNEMYDREYYTGFLGEIDKNNADLFVNLRCMKVSNNKVSLYVGGGITKDSDPTKEWLETVAKSQIMKKVL